MAQKCPSVVCGSARMSGRGKDAHHERSARNSRSTIARHISRGKSAARLPTCVLAQREEQITGISFSTPLPAATYARPGMDGHTVGDENVCAPEASALRSLSLSVHRTFFPFCGVQPYTVWNAWY